MEKVGEFDRPGERSPIQDYVHPDDQTQPTFEMTPGFKLFTIINGLKYKTKSEQEGVRSLPVSFMFYLNHSKKLCRNENTESRINR